VPLDGEEPGTGPDAALRALGLTDREIEVLGLVAEGRSNRQIADELFISAKTASVHVSHILAKFGAATRTEAASRAYRLGALQPTTGLRPLSLIFNLRVLVVR
jgi:DNA-binding NarL/FixJ family response regulator